MPLYSTEAQTDAKGQGEDVATTIVGAKGRLYPEPNRPATTTWCYMFVHHRKVEIVRGLLQQRHHPVFVHMSIVYRRQDKHIRKIEKPTISGLLFVQGDGNEIQALLKDSFSNLYLARDCSKGKIAAIPDCIMQPFMQVSMAYPTRIRFMPHPIEYYSTGNTPVRITSGALAGMEGYRIRISRDKCLVTTLDGMTVAIGGIHRESFENLDEYVHIRRKQLRQTEKRADVIFTPLQQEIDRCFFIPQSQLDVMAMAENLRPWVARMKAGLQERLFGEALEIALFILEETGNRFQAAYTKGDIGKMDDMTDISREAGNVLTSMAGDADCPTDLKETAEAGRESLAIRYPFLPIEL